MLKRMRRLISLLVVAGALSGTVAFMAPASGQEGDAALEEFVLTDDGAHDVELLQLFHRRYLRYKMLCGPEGSAMARHEPIQSFRS